jgi:hypothetical protein
MLDTSDRIPQGAHATELLEQFLEIAHLIGDLRI